MKRIVLICLFGIIGIVRSDAQEVVLLKAADCYKREISTSHSYEVELKVGDYVSIVVEPSGVDVSVVAEGVTIDAFTYDPEVLRYVAEKEAKYSFDVRSEQKGRYTLRVESLRPATEADRELMEADRLAGEVERLYREHKYAEALRIAEKVLAVRERILGDHYQVACAMEDVAGIKLAMFEYKVAEQFLLKALALRERLQGTEHLSVGNTLNRLGRVSRLQSNYKAAEDYYSRALEVLRKALGSEHMQTAVVAGNLGVIYKMRGDYERAERTIKEALKVLEERLGSEHPDVALHTSNLAILLQDRGSYMEAERNYLKALAIYEKVEGSEANVATTLSSLGTLYSDTGAYSKAEQSLERALAIREKLFGAESLPVATVLNNIANMYTNCGDYVKAEMNFLKSASICEKVLGAEHLDLAYVLNNLAELYRKKGDYEKAEPLYLRSLEIRRKKLGESHPVVYTVLENLAFMYSDRGDLEKASEIFSRALEAKEAVFGKEHPDLASILTNIAYIHYLKGEYNEAFVLFQKAVAIREKASGQEHKVAVSLNNLASSYNKMGDYRKAIEHYSRAIELFQHAVGSSHPTLATMHLNLSMALAGLGEIERAVEEYELSGEIQESNLRHNLRTGSENQKLKYMRLYQFGHNYVHSLHLQMARSKRAAEVALTELLRYKGRALDAMTKSIQLLRERATVEDRELLDRLLDANSRLSMLTLAGVGKQSPEAYRDEVERMRQQVEELEAAVSLRSALFKAEMSSITLQAVREALPKDAALVEFTSYSPYNLKTHKLEAMRMAVYVLSRDGVLGWQDLGEELVIHSAVAEFRKTLMPQSGGLLKSVQRVVKPKARALDELVMRPVRRLLDGRTRLLIAPDGVLNLIPFDALVDENGKYLIENYKISYLTSGRDLLRLQTGTQSKMGGIILADPEFGEGPGPRIGGTAYAPLSRLKGAALEAAQINREMRTTVYTGSQATKEQLLRVHGSQVLHVATHGYFLADAAREPELSASQSLVLQEKDSSVDMEVLRSNPLLRSWLFLAGANKSSDGTMTALEVAGLDLYGTRLVVLSACDTGLGDSRNGEGVYGLRRALVLAGSETQLISLWSVSDKATRRLMVDYYRRLRDGEGRASALRSVQLSFLKSREQVQERRRRNLTMVDANERPGNLSHPYYWAAFIQSGEWANLDR